MSINSLKGVSMAKLERKPNQKVRVISYIRMFGYITSWQAYQDLGISQLGARIFELKQDGYVFTKKRIYTKNRMNEKTHYDEYRLAE